MARARAWGVRNTFLYHSVAYYLWHASHNSMTNTHAKVALHRCEEYAPAEPRCRCRPARHMRTCVYPSATPMWHANVPLKLQGHDYLLYCTCHTVSYDSQVEEVRNPALRNMPLGVTQKYLIVTCNYEARKAGETGNAGWVWVYARRCAQHGAWGLCGRGGPTLMAATCP